MFLDASVVMRLCGPGCSARRSVEPRRVDGISRRADDLDPIARYQMLVLVRSRRGSLAVHEARDRISELGRHAHYCCRSVAGATPNIRYYGCRADQPLTS